MMAAGETPLGGAEGANRFFRAEGKRLNSQAKGLRPDVTLESSYRLGGAGHQRGSFIREVISQVKRTELYQQRYNYVLFCLTAA